MRHDGYAERGQMVPAREAPLEERAAYYGRAGQKRWVAGRLQLISDLLAQGMQPPDIGRALGVGRSQVHLWIAKLPKKGKR